MFGRNGTSTGKGHGGRLLLRPAILFSILKNSHYTHILTLLKLKITMNCLFQKQAIYFSFKSLLLKLISGHELAQTLGDNEGKGSPACCSPWGHKVRQDLATEQQYIYIYPVWVTGWVRQTAYFSKLTWT